MHIGLLTDSLSRMPLFETLDAAAELGVTGVEIATGNWSAAPHLNLDEMLASVSRRSTLLTALSQRGLHLDALNASGNILHPRTGKKQLEVARNTILLASELGVETVVMMSGLPAGPGDSVPNWITTCWPPETQEILQYQWEDVAVPQWNELAEFARRHGVKKLALELHPNQLVFNVRSFLKLREAVGDVIGVNLDPSHLMWMGVDPLEAVRALGHAICHVHAKDTRIESEMKLNSGYEVRPFDDVSNRAWNYVTLGRGAEQGQAFWDQFVSELRLAGYDGPLSIEHEDASMSQLEGVRESVRVLREALGAVVST